MVRKSARISSRGKCTETQKICVGSRKRKAEEEPEGSMAATKRFQQYRIENQFIPISPDYTVESCTIIPSKGCSPNIQRHSPSTDHPTGSQFRFQNYFTTPVSSRFSPLPQFSWADSEEVWQLMLKKDIMYIRDPQCFDKHPMLQSRMRAILLDWLVEVCEVYRLHRETYYLAVDFLDRYLSKQRNVLKNQLQLVGIATLFIAAKLEEIYPPKIGEFAYVTDGACTENEILDMELIILKALKWDLAPMTVNSWLNVYLQVANVEQISEAEHGFVFPQYSAHAFVQIARLTDLCMLDNECLKFSYSVVAAAALLHMANKEIALSVSGFSINDLIPCVQWMAPFAATLKELGPLEIKFFPNIPPEDAHNIQTHVVDLSLLEKAQTRTDVVMPVLISSSNRDSPDLAAQIITQLTPQSDKKQSQKRDSLESV